MEKIIFIVDDPNKETEEKFRSVYVFDKGIHYAVSIDEDNKLHFYIYANEADYYLLKRPLWQLTIDAKELTRVGFSPEFIMKAEKNGLTVFGGQGYLIAKNALMSSLQHRDNKTIFHAEDIEYYIEEGLREVVRQDCEKYKYFLDDEMTKNKDE